MRDSTGSKEKADQLRGWKEIGRWFGVDERTVKRWETSRGLPVYRVPGKPRAPVYADSAELTTWMAAQPAPSADAGGDAPGQGSQNAGWHHWTIVALAIVGVLLAVVIVVSRWSSASHLSAMDDRVRHLAGGTLAELNSRLEHQPRTVRLRAALAEEAAAALKDLASQPSATADIRREAAIAYRRLAIINSAADRPSLLDRGGARAALTNALSLVSQDSSAAGRRLRAALLIDASRQAAADGALDQAQIMLNEAAAQESLAADTDLRQEWSLASSEIAQWQGDYARAISFADQALALNSSGQDPDREFRALRAADLVSEAKFYSGDEAGALSGYRRAAQLASQGALRWPNDIRWAWYVGREEWSVGSTLSEMGRGLEAVGILGKALQHWEALSRVDPEDESVTTYVRAVRLSYGGALKAAGRPDDAARVLGIAVGETREWLSRKPETYERQRAMLVRLTALGDALFSAGRSDAACAAYGEAASFVRTIDAAGKLNKLDRDAIVKPLRLNAAAACPTLQL